MIRYKGTALVTGASSGIGEAFARELAARGMDVVLVARSLDRLEALARELEASHAVRAHAVRADLAEPGGAESVFRATQALGLQVTMLVNSAGFATYGPFETRDLAREQEEVMVNVYSLTTLTRLYLPHLLATPGSAVVNVASTAAFQPLPYMAVYGATKAFVLSFSEALWAQFQRSNVTVLAVCPGPVRTRFEAVVGAPEAMVGRQDSPEFVVRAALRALEARRSFVIPRLAQHMLSSLPRLLPRSAVAATTARVLRPRTSRATAQQP
jgi:uncharacterized protein